MREIRTSRSMSGERKRSDGSQEPKPPRLSLRLYHRAEFAIEQIRTARLPQWVTERTRSRLAPQ